MARQLVPSDLVTVETDCSDDGTWVRVVAPARAIRMGEITPVFEDLGINILSYGSEKDHIPHPGSHKPTSFRGKFLVTDMEGNNLEDGLLDQLVENLQRVLHLRLSDTSSVRRGHLSSSGTRERRTSSALSEASTHTEEGSEMTPESSCSHIPHIPRPPLTHAGSVALGSSSKSSCLATRSTPVLQVHFAQLSSSTDASAAPSTTASIEISTAPSAEACMGPTVGASAAGSSSTAPCTAEEYEQDEGKEGPTTPPVMGPVSTIMSSPVRWVPASAPLSQAKIIMGQFQISSLMVDTGTPQPGFLTKRDFLKASAHKRAVKGALVRHFMTQPVLQVTADTPISVAASIMEQRGVRRLVVYDPDKEDSSNYTAPYVGVISETDVFHSFNPDGRGIRRNASSSSLQSVATTATTSHTSCSSLSLSTCDASRLSTEDRYRAAAALWELDFSEIELMRKIGEGSFGEVLLGNFRGTKVAVKRLRGFDMEDELVDPGPSPSMAPVFRQFFEREIEILALIRHPNVVNFIGACHQPPNVCLVTEFCARGSLDHLLHKSGLHLDLAKKVEFAMDVARGMSALHAQRPPIIHRDLKTANLLVSARFEVKVADFGLSRIKDHAQVINSRAGLEGTVEYCAPEVLRGEPYSEKCDVWSFAVVVWELLHRQRPYADADVPIYILMMSLGNGSLRLPPVPPELATPSICKLVERCMSWAPADRPSFREALHILENEYKVIRGKAAAVPRSDSASSMAVPAPGALRTSDEGGGPTAHGQGFMQRSSQPQQQLPNDLTNAAADRHHLPPTPVAAVAAHALAAGTGQQRMLPRQAPAHPPPPAEGEAPGPSLARTSLSRLSQSRGPDTSAQSSAASSTSNSYVGLVQPAASGRAQDIMDTGSQMTSTSSAVTNKSQPPKHPKSRKGPLKASRSRSMPVPAHIWFNQDAGDDEEETEEEAEPSSREESAGGTVSLQGSEQGQQGHVGGLAEDLGPQEAGYMTAAGTPATAAGPPMASPFAAFNTPFSDSQGDSPLPLVPDEYRESPANTASPFSAYSSPFAAVAGQYSCASPFALAASSMSPFAGAPAFGRQGTAADSMSPRGQTGQAGSRGSVEKAGSSISSVGTDQDSTAPRKLLLHTSYGSPKSPGPLVASPRYRTGATANVLVDATHGLPCMGLDAGAEQTEVECGASPAAGAEDAALHTTTWVTV